MTRLTVIKFRCGADDRRDRFLLNVRRERAKLLRVLDGIFEAPLKNVNIPFSFRERISTLDIVEPIT